MGVALAALLYRFRSVYYFVTFIAVVPLLKPSVPVNDPPPSAPLSDEVVNWLLLLRSENASPADLLAFQRWRARDPRHDRAWRNLASALGSTFGELDTHYPPATQSVGEVRPSLARRRFLHKTVALAGGTAALAFGIDKYYPLANLAADQSTVTAQRRRLALPDGSELLLNARTRVNLTFSPGLRQIHLLAGAILATVAPDAARPFRVLTREGSIEAVGTRFMVSQELQRTLVVVEEHEVQVQTRDGVRRSLLEGLGARFGADKVDTPRLDLLDEAAWKAGMIRVNERPLMQVIRSLRPYRQGSMHLSVAAGALPVTGSFPLDDSDMTLRMLAATLPIAITSITPWYVAIDLA